jgi:hypothetical protein
MNDLFPTVDVFVKLVSYKGVRVAEKNVLHVWDDGAV